MTDLKQLTGYFERCDENLTETHYTHWMLIKADMPELPLVK